MSHVHFIVQGRPQPAGSKRGFINPKTKRVIITDDNSKARPWKQEVASAARVEMGIIGDGELLAGPLSLSITFQLARPKGHYGTGRNAAVLKPSAPSHPTVKPDTTKLIRAAEDALTGVVWRDDSQVVVQFAQKVYGPHDCAIVTVSAVAA